MNDWPIDLTPELCDRYGDALQVVTGLASYGGRAAFMGQVATIKAFEDNSSVRAAVAEPGHNRVLVVDGGASMRRAMLGDQLAAKACANGWQAVVINGCLRDCQAIATMDLAVFALGTHPMKTEKLGQGQRDVVVDFGGARVQPGDWMAGDANGIVVSSELLALS